MVARSQEHSNWHASMGMKRWHFAEASCCAPGAGDHQGRPYSG
ncbi:MAG TPA: hypothetical protein VFQ30_18380 [Ktedonobacteraceae bacterium]|nr:hypothetical protein [Ktedonobacteraceae bacterium]